MKQIWLILLIFPFVLHAQTASVTIEACLGTAIAKWPGSRTAANAIESGQLKQRNAGNSWYPQIYMGGQASWQSDVTEVSLPIPNLNLSDILA